MDVFTVDRVKMQYRLNGFLTKPSKMGLFISPNSSVQEGKRGKGKMGKRREGNHWPLLSFPNLPFPLIFAIFALKGNGPKAVLTSFFYCSMNEKSLKMTDCR
jgi:hypothetical protein